MKKNILFVTHSPYKGGAEQSLIHLINNLPFDEFNLFLICPKETKYLNEISKGCEVIYLELPSIKKSFGFKYLKKLLKINTIVKEKEIDIIHANGWRAPWYVAPFKIFKLKQVKTIWHHRDKFNSFFYNVLLPFGFDKIICISNFVKQTISEYHHKRCSVVYNGIDFSQLNQSLPHKKTRNKVFTIGTFGRIVDWKRFDYIIEACALFSKKVHHKSEWKLKIVGGTTIDGSDEHNKYLRELVFKYHLEANVEFLGHVDNPIEEMNTCDVTINFSDREPFGRVIIESLGAKTPVIVANSGGAPEIIRLVEAGFISKDADIVDLAEKIFEVYSMDETSYLEASEMGYNNLKHFFDMEHISRKVTQIYKSL